MIDPLKFTDRLVGHAQKCNPGSTATTLIGKPMKLSRQIRSKNRRHEGKRTLYLSCVLGYHGYRYLSDEGFILYGDGLQSDVSESFQMGPIQYLGTIKPTQVLKATIIGTQSMETTFSSPRCPCSRRHHIRIHSSPRWRYDTMACRAETS